MFHRTQLYEIYRNPELPEEDATMLVRQGFSVWAFFFHMGWLLYQRLWFEAVLFISLYVATVLLGEYYGVSQMGVGLLQLALQVWLGANAADIRAQALERKGFAFEDVVTGTSALEAERRHYYTHTHA